MSIKQNKINILFIGTTDLSCKTVGGQLEKTRLLYWAMKNDANVKLDFCNMFSNKSKKRFGKVILLLQIILKYFRNNIVIFCTSENGTKIMINLMYCLKKISKKPVLFIVVGRQNELLCKIPDYKLKSIDKCYFEIEKMAEDLSSRCHAGYLSNCKNIMLDSLLIHTDNYYKSKPLKLCYYSEISKRKGIDGLLEILDKINEEETKFVLDVYGYFGTDRFDLEKWLYEGSYVSYKGLIKRDAATKVLSEYVAMIFPSRHPLEGVPGAIVDSFEAGTPVISTDVSYLSYVVENEKTGLVVSDFSEMKKVLEDIYDDAERIIKFRVNCQQRSKEYDLKKTYSVLKTDILKYLKLYHKGKKLNEV